MSTPRVLAGCLLLGIAAGCANEVPSKSASKQQPAKVEVHPDEADIYRVTLTPRATERLGITTAAVARRSVARHRTFGGEVIVPPGHSIVVSAPVSGTLDVADEGAAPRVGATVQSGEPVFSLLPLLSPERYVPTPAERVQMANARASLVSARTMAEGDVEQARVQVEAAEIALGRAERLLREKVGSARQVDDAKAAYDLAREALEAAQARRQLLDSLAVDAETGQLKVITITSPQQGILKSLLAARGQTVTAGTPLFEVVKLDTVWIRAGVYVGQVEEVDRAADARVGDLKGGSPGDSVAASPISAPPTADPQSATVDLYYELSNPEGRHYPGQRVGITLPLVGELERLVVPWAAVLHDIHGATWVYEQVADHAFRRRRVQVDYAVDELAVLSAGPEAGTRVVVDGAAELFGTEFGAGK